MIKKTFLLFTVVLIAMTVEAAEITVDGIHFEINSTAKTASVASNFITGYVKIPASIDYENEKYSVVSIGEYAFERCFGLTSVSIPNSVTSIGSYAFNECSGLTSVSIPNSVTSIGSYAFNECSGLTSVSIPNSVTSIEHCTFYGCSGLTSISIPNSVTTIGSYAFRGCRGLTSVSIPNSVTSIECLAFMDCASLTSISIPNSVTSIDYQAFGGCASLTSISIPNGVTSISAGLFSGCASLTSISIPNSVTSISGCSFQGCASLTSISIPNSVTSIGNEAFAGCSSLSSISIPNGVTSIGYSAFYKCTSLTSISIPKGVTNIPSGMLAYCTGLKDIFCYIEEVPSTGASAFEGLDFKLTTLHVPDVAIDDYKSIFPWSQFGKIVTISGSGMDDSKKCEKPVITYQKGKLVFTSETEGAICQSQISNSDISNFSGNEISLNVTYHISVFATKSGYTDSDVATATLCWLDVNPQTEGIVNSVTEIRANPVMIQNLGGMITITGIVDGTAVRVYDVSGHPVGASKAVSGSASVSTTLRSGEVGIVKMGGKTVKVLME